VQTDASRRAKELRSPLANGKNKATNFVAYQGNQRILALAFAAVHATTNCLWREYYTCHHQAKR